MSINSSVRAREQATGRRPQLCRDGQPVMRASAVDKMHRTLEDVGPCGRMVESGRMAITMKMSAAAVKRRDAKTSLRSADVLAHYTETIAIPRDNGPRPQVVRSVLILGCGLHHTSAQK
jgi:hypothetical protein